MRARRLFLLGDPGMGKTTVLRQIAYTYALHNQRDYDYPRRSLVPVFVRLANWAGQLGMKEQISIFEAALVELSVHDPTSTCDWLAYQARKGRLLLLLDGLDEVPDPDLRALVIEAIRAFVREYPKNRVIITCRIVGFETPNLGVGADTLAIQPLTVETMRQFAIAWCAQRHGHGVKRECSACADKLKHLRHAIIDHERIRALAANPMMLTILLLLYEAGATLPQRRWDLYEKIAEAFLFTWEEKKRAASAGAPDRVLQIDDRELVWILESLAIRMQQHDWTLIPRWWLAEHISSFLRQELGFDSPHASAETDALIWSLHERAGLLVERGPGQYGFRHLAFQDYFAARAILAADDAIGSLQPYLYHPRWREVVRLVAAQLDRKRAPQLLRTMLDDPDPPGRFLHRGLLIILGCLVDGVYLHDNDLQSQLIQELESLGRTRWLGITLDAIRLSGQLRHSRLVTFADDALDKILGSAEANLSSTDCTFLIASAATMSAIDADDVGTGQAEAHNLDQSSPVIKRTLQARGHAFTLEVGSTPPDYRVTWAKAMLAMLASAEFSASMRARGAKELGAFAQQQAFVREGLLCTLAAEKDHRVQEAIIDALGRSARFRDVRCTLEEWLNSATSADVRGACARALRIAAARHRTIRNKLISLVSSQEPQAVRAGAARGLSQCTTNDEEVRDLLFASLNDEAEDEHVRIACLWSLERVLPVMPKAISALATIILGDSGNDALTPVVAQVLARYASTARVGWDRLPIERIEQVLTGSKHPCSHALEALQSLVNAREVRRLGIPRETRIARALGDVKDRIQIMFIFGSAARGEQRADSDIDLMVIGDVSLRRLTPGLKQAEQELGRQINVVVYAPEEWARRRRERNPFVTQVLEGERIFVIGGQNELEAMAR